VSTQTAAIPQTARADESTARLLDLADDATRGMSIEGRDATTVARRRASNPAEQSTMATRTHSGVGDATNSIRQRLNVRINPASYQRLMVHCVMRGKQPGEFLDELIDTHCRDWKVQANNHNRGKADDRLEFADDMSAVGTRVA
jgi:hypothetical protein